MEKTQACIELGNYWCVKREHQAKLPPLDGSSDSRGLRIRHALQDHQFLTKLFNRCYRAGQAITHAQQLYAQLHWNRTYKLYEGLRQTVGYDVAQRWLSQAQDEAAERMSYHLLTAIEASQELPELPAKG